MSGDKLKLFERAEAAIKLGLSCGVATERPHNIYQIARELLEAAHSSTELVEALREAETVFALVEHPAFPDPDYQARIEALGGEIGYGALMAGASAAWRKCGIIPGGEFVAGPCQVTVTRTLEMIRKALTLHDRGER